MGAFEIQELGERRPREDQIIAFKIYDSCRQQHCLTPSEIGPARAAERKRVDEDEHKEGDIIRPPKRAASAGIDRLKIKKIIIVDKQPNSFKKGYWDVDIKFVFEYRITFREADACVISTVRANNIHTMKVCLFGAVSNGLVIGTDLLRAFGDAATFDAEPFIMVEAKAISLHANLHYPREPRGALEEEADSRERPTEVWVTIGLFSIIQLFRIVNIGVESRGFNIPDECGPLPTPVNPCAFFEQMDFPIDIFAPPEKNPRRRDGDCAESGLGESAGADSPE